MNFCVCDFSRLAVGLALAALALVVFGAIECPPLAPRFSAGRRKIWKIDLSNEEFRNKLIKNLIRRVSDLYSATQVPPELELSPIRQVISSKVFKFSSA